MVQAEIKIRYTGKAEEEWNRLSSTPIRRAEYLITRHCLDQYLPPARLILDVGSGPGRYAIDLARQGHRVIMFDLMIEMLRFAQSKSAEANTADQALPVNGDMIALPYPANTFDAVISLGAPLSHLTKVLLRSTAMAEMARVVKPGGMVLLTGLNRLAAYRGAIFWLKDPAFFEQVMRPEYQTSGIFTGSQRWYNFAPGELEALTRSSGLEVIDRVGCEGLANHLPLENLEQVESHPDYGPVWQEILIKTCHEPSIIGISNHLLVIARKLLPKSPSPYPV